MKATLPMEYIGQGYDQQLRLYKSILNTAIAGLGEGVVGKSLSRRPWVAEITGRSPKFGYERDFLRAHTDYKGACSTGNRGVMLWFILESGKYYEVKEFTSWKSSDRYFCRVTEDGEIERAGKGEVEAWLNDR